MVVGGGWGVVEGWLGVVEMWELEHVLDQPHLVKLREWMVHGQRGA